MRTVPRFPRRTLLNLEPFLHEFAALPNLLTLVPHADQGDRTDLLLPN